MAVLTIELDDRYLTHLKDKSYYDHNYYKIDISKHGDCLGLCKCDIILEEYDEFSNTFTYSLGFFDDNKFNNMFTWSPWTQPESAIKI